MNERIPSPTERFPTEREVMQFLERFTDGARFVEVEGERREDEQGLYRLTLESIYGNGEPALYSYFRAGPTPKGNVLETAIDVAFLDEDGQPAGGRRIATYREGKWEME